LGKAAVSPEQFTSFGDLLKYLRRREELTQRELAIQVGYSDTQISRIEQNQRVPDDATLKAQFVPALHLEKEADWVVRLLELARQARLGNLPEFETTEKSVTPNNLPALLTTFIGREKEQAEIIQLIGGHRLVTLTGSGGVGKTRISLKVGGQVLGEYANGVWLAELASLSGPELLSQAVASILGIVTQSSTITHTQMLINFLRAKTALLILDNCEHVLDACAQLTDTLLKNCPQLKILATSRQPLGILGEIQYRLPSLGLPDSEQTLEKFRDYESVRLFEERAQLAQPDFKLTMENASSVAQICSRLDGIPLAIELAAARVNIFSTAQIAERLVDSFNLLTGGSRTALPHQQTIRASIDWSWNLISDAERTLLRCLTVFAGGWTLEAAESVCSAADIEAQQIPELMVQLVAKSLVIANRQPGHEQRFHLHETINQYAHEKKVESGEEDDIHNRHLKYYRRLSELAEPALHGPQQMEWYNHLTDERDNLRIALEHASTSDVEAGLYLSAYLLDYWRYFDLREGLRWTAEFVQLPESKTFPHARAKALLACGNILWNLQQFEDARSIAEECLAVFRTYDDRQGEFGALILMGGVTQFVAGMEQKTEFDRQALALARSMGDVWREGLALSNLGWDQRDPRLGRQRWEEGIVLLRQMGDWRKLAETLGILGFTALSNGDLESAQKFLDEAYDINQQINNKEMEFVLTGKGILALLRGEYDQARAFLENNAEHLEEVGNRMGVLWARARIAYVVLREGNLEESHRLLTDAIENFHADRNKSGLAFALDKMASLYVATDKPELAARLIGWSDMTRQEIGDPRPFIEQADLDLDIASIKAKIGSSAFEVAYHSGWEMTLNRVVASAIGEKKQA
jgi:predicted ATPase/transcriptional regulator with XRE-family HTH domain